MENHLRRKEVQEAIKGKIGEDIRSSKTLNIDFLYIAMPLNLSHIIVRVSVPFIQINKIDEAILVFIQSLASSRLILTALLALKSYDSSIIRPINELILFPEK